MKDRPSYEQYEALYTNTKPINRIKVSKAIRELYKFCKLRPPEIKFVDGPRELKVEFENITDETYNFWSHNDIAHFTSKYGIGRSDRLSQAHHLFFSRSKKIGCNYFFAPAWANYGCDYAFDAIATKIWDQSYAVFLFMRTAIIVERPEFVKIDDRGFHNEQDTAVIFKDGSRFYAHRGALLKKKHFLFPEKMTVDEIHSYYDKHVIIDKVGVDKYLEKIKNWKPEVAGKLSNFFRFAEMIVPGDEEIEESWNKKSKGYHYQDKPHTVDICYGTINGQSGTLFKSSFELKFQPMRKNKDITGLFSKEDMKFWKQLAVEDMIKSSGIIRIGYRHNQGFFIESGNKYDSQGLERQVAPAWFRTKMLRGEDAVYENDLVKAEYKNGELLVKSLTDNQQITRNIFRGNQQLPSYRCSFRLESDTWEGLLKEWAQVAFEWKSMGD